VAGLRARFTIPPAYYRALPAAAAPADEGVGAGNGEPASVPRDVLLVEDMMLIALDAEDMMRQLGVETVRRASSVGQALEEIAARPPHFALLDVNLGDESSFEIAERLTQLGIRFAFATGYGDDLAFPPTFADTPKLRKPYASQSIMGVLIG
jgi:CheY-like chemotaxis protein